jgi:hypothetical protein
MEFTIKLPVIFQGRPPRSKATKNIAVYETRKVDITEASIDELVPAMVIDDTNTGKRKGSTFLASNSTPVIRTFDGHFYRKVATITEIERYRLFDLPFPTRWNEYGGFRSSIARERHDTSLQDQAKSESLTAPLFHQLSWEMQGSSLLGHRLGGLWPRDLPPGAVRDRGDSGNWWSRNLFSMDEVLPRLTEFDVEGLERARAMADILIDGFLIVGEDIWERCGSPAYKVNHSGGTHAVAAISLVHAPRWHDRRIDCQYFSLSDKAGAVDFAKALVEAMRSNPESLYSSYQVIDLTVPAITYDPALLELDRGCEELFRISCALAVDNRRFLLRNPNMQARFGEDTVQAVMHAYEEVAITNYLTGEYGTPEDWLEQNAKVWVSCGRHQGLYTYGRMEINQLLIERAKRLFDDRPISLATAPRTGLVN